MTFEIDRASLLVRVPGAATLGSIEQALEREGLTLGIAYAERRGTAEPRMTDAVGAWLARGAPGAPSSFADPTDHLVAGLTATLANGSVVEIRPAPRRAVGPDLVALVVGAHERFASIDHIWLRVHREGADAATVTGRGGVRRVALPTEHLDLDPPVSDGEAALLDAIARELAR
jgi:alkyldihydroxyacetonephosphate synthase